MDNAGNIYIADSRNHRVRKVTPEGAITVIAGDGTALSNGDGGLATSAEIDLPVDVAVAGNGGGNLYILEEVGQRLRVITPDGKIATYAGTGSVGAPSSPTGVATAQPLNNPQGIAVDSSGAVYIADTGNNIVRKVTTDGNIATVAGTGTAGYTGDGGQATSAPVAEAVGVPLASGEEALGARTV